MAKEDGYFKKGERRTGRQAGTGNKVSTSLRDSFLAVYEELQEDEDFCLRSWAMDNLTEFYKLIAKLLPQEYTGEFYTVIKVDVKDENPTNADASENDFG
jgi:hypothetical protein